MNIQAHLPQLLKEALGDVIKDVFTYTPEDAAFPYLTLEWGETRQGFGGIQSMDLILKIWSAYKGTEQLQNLESQIRGFLDSLSINPDHPVSFKLRRTETQLDLSGVRFSAMHTCVFLSPEEA